MQNNRWTQLSGSSRLSLLWASAFANIRAEGTGTSRSAAKINAFDLLIGMLFSHPQDAEPKILLKHFDLTPGQILPADFPRISRDIIERNLQSVTSESAMNLDQETDNIVEFGIKIGMSSGSPEVAELRALFAAMLQTTNAVSIALEKVLDGLGTKLNEISNVTLDYVKKAPGKETYAELLRNRHPFDPRPIDIPNYMADHGQEHKLADDMVGIRAEVDAFAYLLASRGLNPPLAVGLFGDWGSGKSFFMESLSIRIEQLTQDQLIREKPQAEVPFWKRIIQIKFNAWHYMEGELWASLVDHIFSQLRMKGDTEDLVKQRRDHWLRQLHLTQDEIKKLKYEQKKAKESLHGKEKQAENFRRIRESKLQNLEQLKSDATKEILIKANLDDIQKVFDPLLITIGLPTSDNIFQKLIEVKTELKRGRTILYMLWDDKKNRWIAIGSLVCIPALVLILSFIDVSSVATFFSGISATLLSILALIGKALNKIKEQIKKVDEAERKVNNEIEEARKSFDEKVKSAEKEVIYADEKLKSVVKEKQKLEEDLKNFQKKLEDITPARVLTDFVSERVGSGDYRKVLGIPALIQQDFRQLADLISDQNEKILDDKSGKLENSSETFNRIILYIDDLDRCPDDQVIKVLQAVHLLLAFKLFVVVVAVDSRWLSHALTKHFEALNIKNSNGSVATPDDYLEKIFQIPFWIQPLSEPAKRNIIQELLHGQLIGVPEKNGQISDIQLPKVGKEQLEVLATLDPTIAPPGLQTAALSITPAELKFLNELAPILGTTPRSAKRFVNLYQLVRIIYHLDPKKEEEKKPNQCELLAFVLALGEGLPKLGPMVLNESINAEATDKFNTVLLKVKPSADSREVKRLDAWLATREIWKEIPAKQLADGFCKIDRFLFRIGSIEEKQII